MLARFLFFVSLLIISVNAQLIKSKSEFQSKRFLYNKLSQIYGNKAFPILKEHLLENSHLFNGPCDPYETKETYSCHSGINEMRLPIKGELTILRENQMDSLCSKLSDSQYSKIYQNKRKLFSKYYPLKKFQVFLKENELETNISAKNFNYILCMSHEWQTIY